MINETGDVSLRMHFAHEKEIENLAGVAVDVQV